MSYLASFWEDVKDAVFPTAHADSIEDAPADVDVEKGETEEELDIPESEKKAEDSAENETSDDRKEEAAEEAEAAEDGDEDDGDDDDDDDDDDEDETVDPLETLRAKYTEGVCHSFKHHFDECVERVTAKIEESEKGEADEDCVEEFFHLRHCLDENVAKVLFSKLK